MSPEIREVLENQREMRAAMDVIRRDVTNCRVEIAALKTKSKVWGGLVGLFGGGAGAGLAKFVAMILDKTP